MFVPVILLCILFVLHDFTYVGCKRSFGMPYFLAMNGDGEGL